MNSSSRRPEAPVATPPGPPAAIHERTRTVLVGDDDSSGLIYTPMYFHYMSEGDSELFTRLGHPPWEQIRTGITSPVVHASCDYKSPARAGDVLHQRIELYAGRFSSCITIHHFTQAGTAQAVAEGRLVRSWVDMSTMTPRPVPEWIAPR